MTQPGKQRCRGDLHKHVPKKGTCHSSSLWKKGLGGADQPRSGGHLGWVFLLPGWVGREEKDGKRTRCQQLSSDSDGAELLIGPLRKQMALLFSVRDEGSLVLPRHKGRGMISSSDPFCSAICGHSPLSSGIPTQEPGFPHFHAQVGVNV